MELEGGGDWDLGGVNGWNSYPVKSVSPSSCMASSVSLWIWVSVSFGMASTTVGTEVGVASLGVTLYVTLGFIGPLAGARGALRTGRLVAYTGASVFLAVLRPSVAARTVPLGGPGAGPLGFLRRLRVSLLARERLENISISSISRDLGLSLSLAVLDRGRE